MSSAVRSKNAQLRILVLGYVVRGPLAGMAWHHLQYVLGLHELGHEVYFLEDSGDDPHCCYDPTRHVSAVNPDYGLRFAERCFQRLGLAERWAYYDAHTGQWRGPATPRVPELCARADLLLNLSCANPLRPWWADVPVRALIDTDPCFTQIRNLTDPARRQLAAQHTAFFTFGENIGLSSCAIPQDGFPWQPTRQPIVLAAWPVRPAPAEGAFTTVMQWESYPAREYQGRKYGMKSESFIPYHDLPRQTPTTLELAMGKSKYGKKLREEGGWRIINPLPLSQDLDSYQRYLAESKAEFSVAKHGYVASYSGWFSERSACYLASGRPVVVQQTGFSTWLRADAGVRAFSDRSEALEALAEVDAAYPSECRAARAVAEIYFASDTVLTNVLERAFRPVKESSG